MRTLTKTFGLSLIFAAFMMLITVENAQADCLKGGYSNKSLLADSTEVEVMDGGTDEFDFDFEDPFFFSENITINIYNQQDELIYSKSFSKEEAGNDPELSAMLKKSEYLLSIHNQYYYSAKDDVLAMN